MPDFQMVWKYKFVESRQNNVLFCHRGGRSINSKCLLLGVDYDKTIVSAAGRDLTYNPYGYTSNRAGASLAFKGEHLDSAMLGYHLGNGYRFYSPILMRFASPDSQSPFDLGGVNCYGFTSGDPVNASDPTGHSLWSRLFGPIGSSITGKGKKIDGIRVFYSEHPTRDGEQILNVLAHGVPGEIKGKKNSYGPEAFKSLLESHGFSVVGQEMHFIACYSAAQSSWGEASFIKQWSELTGAKTTGYRNPVVALRSSNGENFNAVILPTLRGFEWLLGPESGRMVARPSETARAIRNNTQG